MPMSPQQWWFMMQQLADHGMNQTFAPSAGTGVQEDQPQSTPAPYERGVGTPSDQPGSRIPGGVGNLGPVDNPAGIPPATDFNPGATWPEPANPSLAGSMSNYDPAFHGDIFPGSDPYTFGGTIGYPGNPNFMNPLYQFDQPAVGPSLPSDQTNLSSSGGGPTFAGPGPYSPYDPNYDYGGGTGGPQVILNRYQTPSTAGSPWDEPVQDKLNYPSGNGDYVDLNTDGSVRSALPADEPTGDLQGSPYLANVPGAYDPSGRGGIYYGDKGPGFFSRLGTSLYDLPGHIGDFFGSAFGNVGPATTYAPFGGHPSSYGGGAFASSPGGIPLGLFGQGSAGNLGSTQSYFDRMSMWRLLHGGDPSLGVNQPGQTIRDVSQFYSPPNAPSYRGSDFTPAPVLPPSQWGGVSAANAALYSDQGYRPKGAAGHTTGGGPGGIA